MVSSVCCPTSPPTAVAASAAGSSPVPARCRPAWDVDADDASNWPPRIENLNHLERLCEHDTHRELWQCLTLLVAQELDPLPADYIPKDLNEEWPWAIRRLAGRRFDFRRHIEHEGCYLRGLQEAADIELTDEINFCLGRLAHDPEPEELSEMVAATTPSKGKDSKAKAAKAKPAKPSSTDVVAELIANPDAGPRMVIVQELDLPLSVIKPSPENPREDWDEEFLRQLGESIRDNGQLESLSVRLPDIDGNHELIDGESRYRSAELVGLKTLRVKIVQCTDAQAAMARVLSYRQRRDLNPIEEAHGLQILIDKYGCSQRELEAKIGVSQGQISNRLRLLQLPKNWQKRVTAGELSPTTARALAAWSDVPQLFEELDQNWKNDWNRKRLHLEPQTIIQQALREVTAELSGRVYVNDRYINWKIPVPKLTGEQQAALQIRDIPTGNGRTTEPRALNVKLAEELQSVAIEKAKKAAQAKGDKADRDDDRPITAAEQKARAEKREAIYAKKLWRYYVAWHQRRLLERLEDPDDPPPVEQVALWLLHQGAMHRHHNIHRDDELAEALGLGEGVPRDHLLGEIADPQTYQDRFDEVVYATARQWFSHSFETSGTDLQPSTIVAIAQAGKVDVATQWLLDEAFLLLHSGEQLRTLGKDWKLNLPRAANRSGLINLILAQAQERADEGRPLPPPKCLLKPKVIGLY